jgi:hypothetical protein
MDGAKRLGGGAGGGRRPRLPRTWRGLAWFVGVAWYVAATVAIGYAAGVPLPLDWLGPVVVGPAVLLVALALVAPVALINRRRASVRRARAEAQAASEMWLRAMAPGGPSPLGPEVDTFIGAGKKVLAIRAAREVTGLDLKGAKDLVDFRAGQLG